MAKPRIPKKTTNPTTAVSTSVNPAPANGSAAAVAPAMENSAAAPQAPAKVTATRKPVPKAQVAKAELRATVVPINLDDEIRRLAYLLAERRGFESGHEAEDWLDAEREVRQRYQQHSA